MGQFELKGVLYVRNCSNLSKGQFDLNGVLYYMNY